MTTCVFIIGTNGSGKSTLCREIMQRYGGVKSTGKELTICHDERVCFAGRYVAGSNYGGVDSLNSTRGLAPVVEEALSGHSVVFCEGSYLDTFGINLTNAIFKASKQAVALLYADNETLDRRLRMRSGGHLTSKIIDKQRRCCRAAKKWQSIGVPVYTFNTAALRSESIADALLSKIEI